MISSRIASCLLSCVFFFSCSLSPSTTKTSAVDPAVQISVPRPIENLQEVPNFPMKKAKKKERIVFINPGQIKLLKVNLLKLAPGNRDWQLLCQDKEIYYYVKDGYLKAFLAEDYFSNLTPYDCLLTYATDQKERLKTLVARVIVKKKEYPKEYLKVPEKRVFLSEENQKRVEEEQKLLAKVYAGAMRDRFFLEKFTMPLSSFITSHYGRKRIFNGRKAGQHLGTDFRASVGTPIYASNQGKVVFAGDLFYTGLTVILDHGLGIFTVYGHLSALHVSVGDLVNKSEELGLSGATGRVSGPHLHWGVKVQGLWVDGKGLIATEI